MRLHFFNHQLLFMRKGHLSGQRWRLLAICCLIFPFLFICSGSSAQGRREVSGIVKDANDNPLRGVSVQVKGTKSFVLTDEHGAYRINLDGKGTLLFSYVGMEDIQMEVTGNRQVNVNLHTAPHSLGEVVVVGYGTVKRSDLTGSLSTLSTKDMETRVSTNPYEVMAAKVPGLNIYNNSGVPGGEISFNIRGFSSINGSNTPLVLVDGVITTNLTGYSASDFESVTVLKDASSTAIYGARGSNGVVLMTTKRIRSGVLSVNYDGNASFGVAARHINMLDANGYMQLFQRMWDYDPTRGDYNTVIKPRLHTDYPLLFDANSNPLYNTDWQKAAEQTAVSMHHYLSMTQGNERSRSGIFVGWNDDHGLFRSDYQKKYTYRFNSEYNVMPWMTLGGELNGWSVNQQITSNTGTGGLNLPRTLLETPSILPVRFPDGSFSTYRNWGYNTAGQPSQYYAQGENPVAQSNNSLGTSPVKVSDLRVSLSATIKILRALSFRSVYTNETNTNLDYAWDTYTDINSNGLGSASGSTGRTNTWTSDNYLTYDKTFTEKHHLTVLLGSQWSSSYSQALGASSSGYTTAFYQYNNLGVGSQPPTVSSSYSSFATNSYFGRLNYVYKDKYLATLSTRYDGSSVFGANNKYAMFPSAAVGWVISKENFIALDPALSRLFSFFKLRGSYGLTGNSPSPYSSLGTVGAYTIDLNNQIVKGSGIGGAPNSDLKWERTAQLDIGADLRMFNDLLSLTVDGYSKKTTNLLFNVPVSQVSGYSSVTTNIGSVQNKGLEIMLNGSIIRGKDLGWDLGLTYAANSNKVLALGSTNADVISSGFLGSSTILRVGKPMGSFVGFQRLGTWGTSEVSEAAAYGKKPGDIKRLDVNNDHVFDNRDIQFLGSPFGKYDLTFSTSVRYKNWDLSMDIQVREGNKVENVAALTLEDRTWYATGYATVLKDAWTPTHQNTMVPALRMGSDPWNTDYGSYMDSHWLEDGSFIRGRSMNLNYTVPVKVAARMYFRGLRVYANLDNFFLIAHNRDFDPEASSFGGGYAGQGQTFYGTPRPRTLTFGLNANF
jgi:TonB-linked SusC/RagA family outer membrane protein